MSAAAESSALRSNFLQFPCARIADNNLVLATCLLMVLEAKFVLLLLWAANKERRVILHCAFSSPENVPDSL
jgi:hypothetical protein